MATATESKPRAPKATLVMKLIDGKMVPRLAKSEATKLANAIELCGALMAVPQLLEHAENARTSLETLYEQVGGE